MKILFTIVIFVLIAVSTTLAMNDLALLKQKIDSILSLHQGDFAIAMKELDGNREFYLNEREIFHAASTMKTPVMVEIFRQAAEGKFSLDDSIELKNTFTSIIDGSSFSLDISDDSEDQLYSKIGSKESIRKLVFDMITASSNFATNMLIEKIGAGNVMSTLHRLQLDDIHVLRGVEDEKAFKAGKNNTTDALDLMLLFELIAEKKVVSVQACDEMIDILLHQRFKDMIPASLPDNVKVAHKTGSITNVQHDSGIVYLPGGKTYVLVILSKNLSSNADGIDTIKQLSKVIYNFMVN